MASHSSLNEFFFKVSFAIVSSPIMTLSSLISLVRDASVVDLPCSIAAVPADMNSFLHLYTAEDATLYLRQISDIVEEFESTSITILTFSRYISVSPCSRCLNITESVTTISKSY